MQDNIETEKPKSSHGRKEEGRLIDRILLIPRRETIIVFIFLTQ